MKESISKSQQSDLMTGESALNSRQSGIMENETAPGNQQPCIIKYIQFHYEGVQPRYYSRHGIGYVLRGKKYIYYGDVRYSVNRGEMFYLKAGTHYTEEMPEGERAYEEIVFFYSSDGLRDILSTLTVNYQLQIRNTHCCEKCYKMNHAIFPAWSTVKNYFLIVNQYWRDGVFADDLTVEKMKATELVYLLVSNPDCCIKSKILESANLTLDSFERIVHKHIFDNISLAELAELCNKSLTSFKKDFKEHFHEPPHQWRLKQRLMHSRLLLQSTDKSLSQISAECRFSNASHFIKLFKKEYGVTPAIYRTQDRSWQQQKQDAELESQTSGKHSAPKKHVPA